MAITNLQQARQMYQTGQRVAKTLNVKGQPIVNDLGDCIEFTKRTGVPVLTEEI